MRPRSKYNVDQTPAGKLRRSHKGRTYSSAAEHDHAVRLDLDPTIELVIPQPTFWMGDDFGEYRADFLVIEAMPETEVHCAGFAHYAVEVKGYRESERWRMVRDRLWSRYGPCPLHVVKNGATVSVIEGQR